MKVKFLLIGVIVTLGMLAGSNYAEIDPSWIVGIWTFDEGSGEEARDVSGNGHDGKVPGDVKWVDGPFGTALEFDGSPIPDAGGDSFLDGSVVEVPYHDDLNLRDVYSLVAWVKVDPENACCDRNPEPWGGIIVKRNHVHDPASGGERNWGHWGLWVGDPQNGGGQALWGNMAGRGEINQWWLAKRNLADGEWHHVAAVWDRFELIFYVDGVDDTSEDGNVSGDAMGVIEQPLTIGGDLNNHYFSGAIDEAAIFSEPLSEGDIQDVMGGLGQYATAVDSYGKLAVTWASIKAQ